MSGASLGYFSDLPDFSIRRIRKYAEKLKTVIAIARISWNNISTSCEPRSYLFLSFLAAKNNTPLQMSRATDKTILETGINFARS